MNSLDKDRHEFIQKSGRFLAFPIAGAIVWLAVGFASLMLSPQKSLLVLLFGTGTIFPLALGLAQLTKQEVFLKNNRFGTLAGQSVLMVNLLWALHLSLVYTAPEIVPLSIAIGLGLHWVIYSWIVEASFGIIHATVRTVLCTVAYHLFPSHQLFAVAVAVVMCYAMTCFQLVVLFRKKSWN